MSRSDPLWSGGLGPHPVPGDTLGRYQIVDAIGAGGMATVYRARDDRGAAVALKVLNPARVLPEDVKRFTREYKALSRMDHENIVKVYEAGVHQGYPWIAMELVEGTDLDAEIERWRQQDPPDRWDRVTRILRGLCRGLAYVHDLGLIHRDLKPSNVLIDRRGEPKISDFGVVKSGDNTHSTQLTMAGRLVGTVAFMAPELITDEGVDRRTDLYALGAVLYLMCTLRRPIEAESVAGYLARHLTEVPRPPGELEPATPPVLERICVRLLHKERAFRYPSAQAVLQALDRPEDPDAPPLRGRDAIQARWTASLLALQEGVGSAVALVGPVGSGKSHLLSALVEQVHSHGLRVARARGRSGMVGEWSAQLGGKRTDDWDALARRLPAEPTVLAVDDVDAAGPEGVAALARLVRQQIAIEARPVLVLIATRQVEGELAALLGGASTGLPFDTIELGPIEPKAVIALLRDRGVTGPLAPVLARRLHAEYGGMPGPMVEQLDALVAERWLRQAGDRLEAVRSTEDFRRAELPVPEAVRARVLEELDVFDARSRELCELLGLLDRPASTALLERCCADDPETPRRIDALVRRRVLDRTSIDAQEVLTLADPCAARVVRSVLDPARKRALHGRIAAALSARKRRAVAQEIAHHLERAGDRAGAWPLYVQAARRSAREGRFSEVLDLCEAAEAVRAEGERALDPVEAARTRRWANLLRGEALLARRAWDEAVAPLQEAAEAARAEGDAHALARCLGSLGRAHYRAGRFAEAEPLMRTALEQAEPGAPERAAALRALADIALRAGRLEDASELWDRALRVAIDMGSRDAEARARRGLAHLRGIEGRLAEAVDLLAQADDLLIPDGDYRVRAGVLARAVELDTAAGRLGSALYRAELLVDLARRHGMAERLPEAYALLAELLVRVGDPVEAEDAAQQSLVFARASGGVSWDPRLRAARVLVDLDRRVEAQAAMPSPEEVPAGPVYDPPAQLAAVRARLFAPDDPARALDLSAWALSRTPPLLVLAGTRVALDCALALHAAQQQEAARNAVKHGLKRLQGVGGDGLRLELLVVMELAQPDERVRDAIRQIARRMIPLLPPQSGDRFSARPGIREALTER